MKSMSACRTTARPTVNAGTLNGAACPGRLVPVRFERDDERHAVGVEAVHVEDARQHAGDSAASTRRTRRSGRRVEPRRLIWSPSTAAVRRKRL